MDKKKEDILELRKLKSVTPKKMTPDANGPRISNSCYGMKVQAKKLSEDSKVESLCTTGLSHTYNNVFSPALDYEIMCSSNILPYEEFFLEEIPFEPEVDTKAKEKAFDMKVSESIKKFDEMLLKDETLSICNKLRYAKKAFSLFEKICFVVQLLYLEISGIIFLNVYHFLAGLYLLALSIMYFSISNITYCTYLILPFSEFAILTAILELCKSQTKDCWVLSIASCVSRFFKMITCIIGVCVIYIYYPPEENDSSGPNFCPPLLYWSELYIFTLSSMIYSVECFTGVIVIMWY